MRGVVSTEKNRNTVIVLELLEFVGDDFEQHHKILLTGAARFLNLRDTLINCGMRQHFKNICLILIRGAIEDGFNE